MSNTTRHLRAVRTGLLAAALAAVTAACGSSAAGGTGSVAEHGVTTLQIAAHTGAPFAPTALSVHEVAAIRAKLPESVRRAGTLTIGLGALPAGFPPLAFVGTDQRTLTGSEPDLGRAVAAVLGLRPVIDDATWENLFVGLDSGRIQVAFSNVTDTEERKKKYDFATYRKDNLAFEVRASDRWNFGGDWRTLAGKTVAVSAGTNQELLLRHWRDQLADAGKTLTIKNFAAQSAADLALASGRIDAYLGPNPGIQYHIAQVARSATPTRTAGTYSGAGSKLQGLIAATTKKDDGLIGPVHDALQTLIDDGQYAAILKAYHLSNEAVASSQLNPPGLPVSNS